MDRRDFVKNSTFLGAAGMITPNALANLPNNITKGKMKDDISLAQWALVDEIRGGKWKNLDFPRIAREDFDLNGIEFVNTLFEVPTVNYLNQLKKNADDHGVEMVLIMVDAEGDGAEPTKELRKQFEINHRKWVDIAHYLGCHAVRTNCRAPKDADPMEALKWATESYQMLLDYAEPSGIKIVIENHGGVSNDPDWMVKLMKAVNSTSFGTYPDWRRPADDFDNVVYLEKTLPYALGMSYRNQPTEELTAKMIKMAKDSGYQGWYGIESSGRDEIKQGIDLLKKYLLV
ncbi:MAG: sugar phosphate isomerase/epimerase [Saprospiraceae bacterium]|nr:sugar phosphate isomerase/epimerase [Saprospiraceae bacterium]